MFSQSPKKHKLIVNNFVEKTKNPSNGPLPDILNGDSPDKRHLEKSENSRRKGKLQKARNLKLKLKYKPTNVALLRNLKRRVLS